MKVKANEINSAFVGKRVLFFMGLQWRPAVVTEYSETETERTIVVRYDAPQKWFDFVYTHDTATYAKNDAGFADDLELM